MPVVESFERNRSDGSASTNLLYSVRQSDPQAWQRFALLYSPWVYCISRRAGLGQEDAADVSQEVFMTAAMRIDSFHRDRAGQSMRSWLARIAHHKIGDWLRSQAKSPTASGSNDAPFQQSQGGLSAEEAWEDELPLLRRAIELIQTDFEETTWVCFRRMVLEECAATEVAADLGMTPRAVRQAKYRVIRRLREEFDGLLD